MIKLNSQFVTVINHTFGGQTQESETTDTLFISSVRIDFTTGAMYAVIQRGTVVNSVFTSNYPDLNMTVNPDGSFVSDGGWNGSVAAAPALVAQLKSQFDQFILASGLIQGTTI
jgi:hypothetical protein